jgi:outer membrane receptor protein involved in Fe transport
VKLFLIAFFLGAFALPAMAQTFNLSGKVVDVQGQPIPYANVAVYSTSDSVLVTGNVSNDEGVFSIPTPEGRYYVMVTFLSFEENIISGVNVAADVSLGDIVLKPAAQILESVTVKGEAAQMELQLDKRIFQVGKDLSNISGSAADILENIPSVTVDVEGNVSLRGSQNVRILIDGRPSGLTGISPADALRQLQGNLIERIEVVTNPSARYDAEGEVGIINIIMKKEKQKGLNGTFTLTGGYPDIYGAAFNVNFRKKNLNYFLSYGLMYRSAPGQGNSFQSFNTPDTSLYYLQTISRTRSDLSHNFKGGMDFYFNDKTSLTGSFLLRSSESNNKATNNYFDYSSDDVLRGNVLRQETEVEPEFNSEIGLTFRKEFDKKDQEFTVDFKWIENQETEKARYGQYDLLNQYEKQERSTNTEDERNVLLQADYIHPFGAHGKFETGLKGTLRVIDNNFQVDSLGESDSWITNAEYDNHLVYDERIYAAYAIVGNQFRKLSWQTGLRSEWSLIEAEMRGSDETTRQEYMNFFPSVHLSYKMNQKRSVQLSYSYRISRPRFRDLMPFSNYSDNRSVMIGNPALRPEYTHSTELGYLLNWSSGSLLTSMYYRYRTGVVERIPLIDSTAFTRSFPINIGNEDSYGLEFNLTLEASKWWKFNGNLNAFRAITEGRYDDQDFFADTYSWTSRVTSNMTLLDKYDFQVSYNYRAPRKTTQGRDKSMYFIDLGLSRDVLKGKGTITLGVRDLLNSRKFRSVTTRPDEGYYAEREFQGRKRQFIFTFSYRLNRNKDSQNRQEGGDDDF